MHMADALLSPAVGGTMWVVSAVTIAVAARRLRKSVDDCTIPLMGVLGAFVFAVQMINFTIPGTGSSGHLGGGLLLAALLGPSAAFLSIASILTVQALFFADGGLLALGSNIFNLGVLSCFIAYPCFRRIAGIRPTPGRLLTASMVGAIMALQLGALAVVLQTVLSRMADLPFGTFLLLMQPIHLAIGAVEGVITVMVVAFIWKARPELLEYAATGHSRCPLSLRRTVLSLALSAAFIGGVLSWFAASAPDGLEWSLFHATGVEQLVAPTDGIYAALSRLQQATAFLPDYNFPGSDQDDNSVATSGWPAADAGTTVAGLLGGGVTVLLVAGTGLLLKRRSRTAAAGE
jgi:cobalt/nickel transport system permease protein